MGSFGRCPYFLEKTGIGPAIARDAERPQDVATLHRLSTLWATAILRHPIAYLAHRLGNFNSASFFLVPWHHTSGEVGMNASGGRGHGLLDKLLDWLHYLPLLAPIVLMTLGAILVGMLRIASKAHSYAGDAAVALALSSTLYGLSFLILGVATDLRYFFYVMVGLPISTVIAFAGPTFVRRGTQRRALAVLFALPLLVFVLTMSARLTLHPPAPKLTLPAELGASAPAAQPL
jgi:hypothetical protein